MKEIIKKFGLNGDQAVITPLGNGLINSTLLVEIANDKNKYVLQRINDSIFTDVPGLQHNIKIVTDTIDANLRADGLSDTSRRCLHFLKNIENDETYYRTTDGEYYRIMEYIPDSITHESITPELAAAVGRAIGEFQRIVAPLASQLTETIPHFHDMSFRISQLREAIKADVAGRSKECRDLIEDLDAMSDDALLPEKLYEEGKLPLRVCHCDTKVNNILFDKEGDILCVIDLDTVMPSLILSDYGDFLRTGACTAPEDEPDLSRIGINHEIYENFTDGYLSTATFLTQIEKDLLHTGMFRFAYMQAVRFLTDYINGDTYFKILYPEHNLVRARAQLRLAKLAKDL